MTIARSLAEVVRGTVTPADIAILSVIVDGCHCRSLRVHTKNLDQPDLALLRLPTDDSAPVLCDLAPWRLKIGHHIYPFTHTIDRYDASGTWFIVTPFIASKVAVHLLARGFVVDHCTAAGKAFLPADYLPRSVA